MSLRHSLPSHCWRFSVQEHLPKRVSSSLDFSELVQKNDSLQIPSSKSPHRCRSSMSHSGDVCRFPLIPFPLQQSVQHSNRTNEADMPDSPLKVKPINISPVNQHAYSGHSTDLSIPSSNIYHRPRPPSYGRHWYLHPIEWDKKIRETPKKEDKSKATDKLISHVRTEIQQGEKQMHKSLTRIL
ncbi:hypothetical protein P9112_008769 [Eukaryota sp. TZLM1-RC]